MSDRDETSEYYLANGLGDSVDSPSSSDVREMLMALDLEDEEHGEVWLAHAATEDAISWLVDGRLQQRRPASTHRTLCRVTQEQAVEYFRMFAAADDVALDTIPWQLGDGDARSPEERQRQREVAEAPVRAQLDREFLAELGSERAEESCRQAGCSRGAVRFGVLCRAHHFEAVMKRPCPFD